MATLMAPLVRAIAAAAPASQIQNRGGDNNSAFANSGSARSERTASNRGQASMGGGSAVKKLVTRRCGVTASNRGYRP